MEVQYKSDGLAGGKGGVMNTSISFYFILPFLSIHNKVEY